MSALYQIGYQGVTGTGHGALYVGKGLVLGSDVTGGVYKGAYSVSGGRLIGKASLTAPNATLVTGQTVPPGHVVQIDFNLSENFADGRYHSVAVDGVHANVSFTKIGEIS